YWSVLRELWENHSLYIAPSIVAAIILFGSFVGSFHLPGRRQNALLLDPTHRQAAIELPYDVAAMMFIFTAFIIGVFYCLDTLHFAAMLGKRLMGFAPEAFDFQPHHAVAIDSLTPGKYLSTPDLWIGLAFAAAFTFAAIRLRRYRGPL